MNIPTVPLPLPYIARFLGDPSGYHVTAEPSGLSPEWVAAEVGGRVVMVDLAKAYLVEPDDQEATP